MSTAQPRRPAGVPTGGQFSTKDQPAPGYTLDDGPGPATIDGLPVEPEIFDWDLDWSKARHESVAIRTLSARQYPDGQRPKGRFDIRKMPPIHVLERGGKLWIMDGHHRVDWAVRAGRTEIPALVYREDHD